MRHLLVYIFFKCVCENTASKHIYAIPYFWAGSHSFFHQLFLRLFCFLVWTCECVWMLCEIEPGLKAIPAAPGLGPRSHPRLAVLEARLCSVFLWRPWFFMMASCLCLSSRILPRTSSSEHTSGGGDDDDDDDITQTRVTHGRTALSQYLPLEVKSIPSLNPLITVRLKVPCRRYVDDPNPRTQRDSPSQEILRRNAEWGFHPSRDGQ